MIKLDKVIQMSIIVTLLLIGLSVFYYFVIFLPKEEKVAELQLNSCIKNAENQYHRIFQEWCEDYTVFNHQEKTKDCSLPEEWANKLSQKLRNDKETCARLYK